MADRPPLATIDQLIVKIGYTPPASEYERAEDCLAEASELIRDEAEITWLNEAGDAVVDVPYAVQRVCIAVAYRGFDNARALSQRSVGDSSQSWDRNDVPGGEAVYLTDSEKRRVRKAAGGSSFRSHTMTSPYSGDAGDLTGLTVSLDTV